MDFSIANKERGADSRLVICRAAQCVRGTAAVSALLALVALSIYWRVLLKVTTSSFWHLAADDGLGAPNIVHYVFGMTAGFGHVGFGLIHLLSVLASTMYIRPAEIRWHGLHFPPADNPWWACAEPLVRLVQEEDVSVIHGRNFTDLHVAHKADIIRMRILREEGGIYLDSDVIPLASFDEVRRAGGNDKLVMGREWARGRTVGLCNAVMVGVANTSFIRRWWDAYKSFNHRSGWNEFSVRLPWALAQKHPAEIAVLDRHAFFTPSWDELPKLYHDDTYGFQENYAVHLWTSKENREYGRLASLSIAEVVSGVGSFHRAARRVLRDAHAAGLLRSCSGAMMLENVSWSGLGKEVWTGMQHGASPERALR